MDDPNNVRLFVAFLFFVAGCGIALAWKQWAVAAIGAGLAVLVYAIGGHL